MAQTREKAELPRGLKEAYQKGVEDGRRQASLDAGLAYRTGDGTCDACAALIRLMGSGLRHVRLTAHDDGKTVYAKAAIQTFQWERHYVLYTGVNWPSPLDYLSGLLKRVDLVDAGRLRPSPDRYDAS